MPFAQYESTRPFDKEPFVLGRFMPVPKRVGDMNAWFKTARSVIPQIPDPLTTDWYILDQEATLKEVRFKMLNSLGQTGLLVIDRTKRGLGA